MVVLLFFFTGWQAAGQLLSALLHIMLVPVGKQQQQQHTSTYKFGEDY
jgi:hypothetical protein